MFCLYYWHLQNIFVLAKFQSYLQVSDLSSFSQLVEKEGRRKRKDWEAIWSLNSKLSGQCHQNPVRIWNDKTITSPSPGGHPCQVQPVRSQGGHNFSSATVPRGTIQAMAWKHRSPGARTFSGGHREMEKACLHLWPERPLTVTRQDRSAAPSPSDLHKYILSSSVKDKLMTAAYLLSFWLWIFLWMLWYKMGESNGDFESQTQQAACLLRQAEMRPGVRQDWSFEQFHPQVRIQSYFTKSLLKTVTHHRDREIDLVLKLPPNFHSCSLCCMQRPDFQKAGLPLQRPALVQFCKPALIST